jgi:hypothetical protein
MSGEYIRILFIQKTRVRDWVHDHRELQTCREKARRKQWVCVDTSEIARRREVQACFYEGVVQRQFGNEFDTW